MTKTVVIHQPDFAPWLGFFHRFLNADLWIVLDHVDFPPRNWTHRDKIKTRSGPDWLSLSVDKAPRGTPIADIQLKEGLAWRERHLNLLRENYASAAHFAEIFPEIEALYANAQGSMAAFNLKVIDWASERLAAPVARVRSSELAARGAKSDLLADLVAEVGGGRYLTGQGARDYLVEAPFRAAGIEVVWQDFKHPVYPQPHGAFEPFLSVFDVLLNAGAGARELLRRT